MEHERDALSYGTEKSQLWSGLLEQAVGNAICGDPAHTEVMNAEICCRAATPATGAAPIDTMGSRSLEELGLDASAVHDRAQLRITIRARGLGRDGAEQLLITYANDAQLERPREDLEAGLEHDRRAQALALDDRSTTTAKLVTQLAIGLRDQRASFRTGLTRGGPAHHVDAAGRRCGRAEGANEQHREQGKA